MHLEEIVAPTKHCVNHSTSTELRLTKSLVGTNIFSHFMCPVLHLFFELSYHNSYNNFKIHLTCQRALHASGEVVSSAHDQQ